MSEASNYLKSFCHAPHGSLWSKSREHREEQQGGLEGLGGIQGLLGSYWGMRRKAELVGPKIPSLITKIGQLGERR